MSRQPDYNQYNSQYAQYSQYPQHSSSQYPQYSQYNRPESSRNWSEEAVRGSWESSYQRSTAVSPRDRDTSSSSARAVVPRAEREARAHMVDSWIGQQRTQDPSRVMDAVSDWATPESSPCISDGSSTFQTTTQHHSYGTPAYPTRHSDRAPVMPADYHYTTSSPSRTAYRPDHRASSSRDAGYSADYDLRGVGSFTEHDRSRGSDRKVKYKPLTNWFDMWLP
ncbi:hypothetical protein B0T10DRAFT_472787 [Thelonectria olida]|uniref:Uncharacterized protein n=1 Tax=Thelonectria olida TaxID=1576542 RepID=A0A9P8WG55_9HYPO|nr:hypothetical protein B0T10DRAFT_472787 [Thelonectria olida]